MMRSMYSGVSGLRIHQTRMDVIGNNIANVNTTGFKSGRVTFNEIFSQTLQGASGASESIGGRNPMQVGLGANISSIDTLMTEGAAQRTDNPLDMKIEGDGFFIVKDGGGFKFTRAGAFRLDEVGNLCNPEGLNVMGWRTDPTTGNIVKDKVNSIKILSPENMYSDPSMTKNATVSGNIQKNDPNLDSAKGVYRQVPIYDSLGYKYTVDLKICQTATANEFDIRIMANSLKDKDGNKIGSASNPIPATDANKTATFDVNTGKVVSSAADGSDTRLELTLGATTTGFSKFSTPIKIDFSNLTLFDGKTTVEAVGGDEDGLGAGAPAGKLSSFEIGTDGKILGKYSNSKTKILGQIAVANFQNPAGLQKVGNNLFQVTSNSGEFDGIGKEVTEDGGSLNGGVLEMSNVDLSREFTDMITTQRGFQANSRIITASDEMLQELVNLKR
ncbi:flagellar hook protein FlgE [Vallitalea guaymasensis]|uniref:Flagellar hook protein FlgE n=1 Tax=Vallitalea guaymasensis TaxID=1185412 RepID=A0A8J8MF27_9FIRM|nr:flagellar hook protein FlgE [Vallitalea guaymasensis]QUH31445.1 flagellar hook protein FlgE [Vallitalea guaymasensis]